MTRLIAHNVRSTVMGFACCMRCASCCPSSQVFLFIFAAISCILPVKSCHLYHLPCSITCAKSLHLWLATACVGLLGVASAIMFARRGFAFYTYCPYWSTLHCCWPCSRPAARCFLPHTSPGHCRPTHPWASQPKVLIIVSSWAPVGGQTD